MAANLDSSSVQQYDRYAQYGLFSKHCEERLDKKVEFSL